jgi:hypothetical protein
MLYALVYAIFQKCICCVWHISKMLYAFFVYVTFPKCCIHLCMLHFQNYVCICCVCHISKKVYSFFVYTTFPPWCNDCSKCLVEVTIERNGFCFTELWPIILVTHSVWSLIKRNTAGKYLQIWFQLSCRVRKRWRDGNSLLEARECLEFQTKGVQISKHL